MCDSKYDVDACIEDFDERLRHLELCQQDILILLTQMCNNQFLSERLAELMRPRSTTVAPAE